MITPQTTLPEIKQEIAAKKTILDQIHAARKAISSQTPAQPALAAPPLQTLQSQPIAAAQPAAPRTFNLLAQGDSWFDYPPGTDIIDCLRKNHGHKITNIAVAGSTLNDEAYGPVPRELFGLPNVGPALSNDPSRIAELVNRIEQDGPDGLLISAGGNDVAGDEFFSFINNANSGLPSVNPQVLDGVISTTFRTAYEFIIRQSLGAKANLPIFLHGYDYPWPDGRGVLNFIGWRIGPWFDNTFNQKNYPNSNAQELQIRYTIVKSFIDALNAMQRNLVQQPEFLGKVFYVKLTGTLQGQTDWANELHPGNDGFAALAVKIDAALQANIK